MVLARVPFALPESLSAPMLGVAMVVTLVAAVVQGTLGTGFAILSVPVLSLLHPALAPVPQLVLSLPMTVAMAWREREAVEFRSMGFVFVGRAFGIGLGVGLVALASQRVLDAAIAVLVLVAVALLSSSKAFRRTSRLEVALGVASGVSGYVSAIGGPALALLYRNAKGAALRANLAVQFAFGVTFAVAMRLAFGQFTQSDGVLAAWLLVPMLLGLRLSGRLTRRIDDRRLWRGVLLLCAVASLGLLGRALIWG